MKLEPSKQPLTITEAEMLPDGVLHLDLWYPRVEPIRNETKVKALQIGLMDVRATDDIRVSYDFERDGWKIEQASIFSWDVDDEICDPDWQEVAFVKAWAREKKDDEHS